MYFVAVASYLLITVCSKILVCCIKLLGVRRSVEIRTDVHMLLAQVDDLSSILSQLFFFITAGGNKRFRDLVARAIDGYNHATSRLEKTTVVNEIVEKITAAGGRFLRRDEKTGTWHCKYHKRCFLLALKSKERFSSHSFCVYFYSVSTDPHTVQRKMCTCNP